MEYRPSRRGLFLAAPTKPARAVRNVKRPSPPNAQMNLQAWTQPELLHSLPSYDWQGRGTHHSDPPPVDVKGRLSYSMSGPDAVGCLCLTSMNIFTAKASMARPASATTKFMRFSQNLHSVHSQVMGATSGPQAACGTCAPEELHPEHAGGPGLLHFVLWGLKLRCYPCCTKLWLFEATSWPMTVCRDHED